MVINVLVVINLWWQIRSVAAVLWLLWERSLIGQLVRGDTKFNLFLICIHMTTIWANSAAMSPLGPVLAHRLPWAPVRPGKGGAQSINICRGKAVGLMEHNGPCPLPPEDQHRTWAEIPLTHRRAIFFWEFLFLSSKNLSPLCQKTGSPRSSWTIHGLLLVVRLLKPAVLGQRPFRFCNWLIYLKNIYMECLQSWGH